MNIAHETQDTAPSQTSRAYRALRREILSGACLPGARLKIADIADRLSLSPGAVREALSRLVPEQLVIFRDQRGFLVAPLSLDDLTDLTDVRCELESIAVSRSVARGGLDWEAEIVAAFYRLKRTHRVIASEPAELNPEWMRNHAAFHTALVAACGSRRLLDLHVQFYEQAERYLKLSVTREDGHRDVDAEHQEIMDAALARNADELARLLVEHIRTTTRLIVETTRP